MYNDMLVNQPVKRDDDDLLIEEIEREIYELEKKKKADMDKEKLKEEMEMIDVHIKNALQLQLISVNLAAQYRDKLKRAGKDRHNSFDGIPFFRLNELPGMIEERRRRKKLKDDAEAVMKKIKENPDYCPSSYEHEILNNWDKEKNTIQRLKDGKADGTKEIEKG